VTTLLATAPFKERQMDINVWGLVPPAAQSGISRPSQNIYRRSPVGAMYDAFDSERYVLTFENKAFRDIAANAPYEVVEILVNSATYGGGGIYGLYSTVAADSVWAPYIFVHEFGHHIAGLADEYYTSYVAYLPATDHVEPWEPNVTALLDPAALKWKISSRRARRADVAKEGSSGTEEIQQKRRAIGGEQARAEMDALFREGYGAAQRGSHAGKVGAFERELRGARRLPPQADCIMFTPITFRSACLPPGDRPDPRSLQPLGRPQGLRYERGAPHLRPKPPRRRCERTPSTSVKASVSVLDVASAHKSD
jgi:hypothetical protein